MPMSYDQILPYLTRKGWVELKALAPMIPPYPPNFDENSRCGYNDGSLGYTINNCNALKYKVQEFIDAKLLTFKELDQNMKNNPLPGHPGPSINYIEEFVETDMVKEVKKVKTHMLIIHEKLTKEMIIQYVHSLCQVCLSSTNECEELKRCLQELMTSSSILHRWFPNICMIIG